MNLNDLPNKQPDIEELKIELQNLCKQYAISRFEPEDIVELLEDGEDAVWIVNQLRQAHAELDAEKFTSVLIAIQSFVAPPREVMEKVEPPLLETEEEIELPEEVQPFDLSQIDLQQIAPQLEALTGMRLPAGIDLNQIKKIMASPQGAFLTDFGLFCQEQGIDMNAVSNPEQLQTLNEQWLSTPRMAFEGKTPAEVAQHDPSLFSLKKVETYRRPEPRIGRNDPCPCGSGKKYKKCCGQGK